MQITFKPLSELIPYSKNPRKNDEAVEFVANSIKEFGFKVPIVIDGDGIIVAGHTRYKAAKKLKLTEVPCIIADDLTEEQIKAYRLADNRVAEKSEWDIDLLSGELDDILNIDMAQFDFDLSLDEEETEVAEDDFDGELPEEPKAKLGDTYKLGNHRLMCGDSTSVTDVEKLMYGNKADMVFTDPPYGLNYSGGRTGGSNKPAHGKILNDELKEIELGNLICNVFMFNKSEADVYICCSPIIQKPFLDWLETQGKEINAVIVWDKKQAGLGYMAYRRQCEFILFVKGGQFHKGDKSDFDLWSISKENTSEYVHGTQKPIGVPARAIKNSCKEDDIVLDLFGGSGSTLIACEQLNRNCYMMELDPKYVDVIINRWEQFTGQQAELIEEVDNGN